MRETRTQWYKPPFRSPLYPWIQGLWLVSGGVLLVVMGPVALVAALITVVFGAGLYFVYGYRHAERLGAIGKRGRRRELLTGEASRANNGVGGSQAMRRSSSLSTATSVHRTMLVELGHALSEGGKIEVLHLTELPEQVGLDAGFRRRPQRELAPAPNTRDGRGARSPD